VTQAAALAKRCREHADDTSERIRWAHQLLYGRPVTEEELLVALAFLGNDGERGEDRWEQYAQVLLASNEMMVVD
jgi:hypothetical protein